MRIQMAAPPDYSKYAQTGDHTEIMAVKARSSCPANNLVGEPSICLAVVQKSKKSTPRASTADLQDVAKCVPIAYVGFTSGFA